MSGHIRYTSLYMCLELIRILYGWIRSKISIYKQITILTIICGKFIKLLGHFVCVIQPVSFAIFCLIFQHIVLIAIGDTDE